MVVRQYLYILLPVLCLFWGMAGFGLIELYFISPYIFYKQVAFVVLGTVAILVLGTFSARFYYELAYFIFLICLLLLVLTIFFGEGLTSKRWLNLGIFHLQSAEIAKVGLLLVLAKLLGGTSPYRWALGCVPLCLTTLLVFYQPDLGTALLLAMIGVSVFFLAGIPKRYIYAFVVMVVVSLPILWQYLMRPYQKERILTFLGMSDDPLGSGYQITQSKIAVGSGGIAGKGLGLGTQSHMSFVPEVHTDFILAAIAEDMGLIGVITLCLFFLSFLLWCWKMAYESRSAFGYLFAGGGSCMIFAQMFINMGMIVEILPVVGMPMPFVSYGGSSMLNMVVFLGICVSLKRHKQQILQ